MKKFLYLGYDKETIQKCRPLMDLDNIMMVRQVSFLLIGLVGILLLFYTTFDYNLIRNSICIGSVILLFAFLFITRKMLNNPALCTSFRVDCIINVLSILALFVGIYMGTFASSNEMAVAPIWMFLFITLIFNRLPLQNIYILLISGILFLICSYASKNYHHFTYDTVHIVISIQASIFMTWAKSKMKVDTILVLQELEEVNASMAKMVEKQQLEAIELRHQAQTDELSGFYTKQVFEKTVIEKLENNADGQHVFICCDIDDFKKINDNFGHLYGDKVLKEMVDTILASINMNKICGRFGGDEFIIFISDVSNREEMFEYINTMCQNCDKTYRKYEIEQRVSLSLGVAFYPEDGTKYTELFKVADKRLYEVKNRKKRKIES